MDLFLSFSKILVFHFKFDDHNIPSNYIKYNTRFSNLR